MWRKWIEWRLESGGEKQAREVKTEGGKTKERKDGKEKYRVVNVEHELCEYKVQSAKRDQERNSLVRC